MNQEIFVKGLALLQEAFPNKKINAKIYFEALKDISDEHFLAAVTLIVQTTTKLYPDDNLIAMIREKVIGRTKDRAVLAWDMVLGAISSHGAYQTICFRDRVINGAIQAMGGWEKVCGMLVEDEPFRKKDFIELYEAILNSGRFCPEKLVGYHERLNGKEEPIALIGAPSRLEIETQKDLSMAKKQIKQEPLEVSF